MRGGFFCGSANFLVFPFFVLPSISPPPCSNIGRAAGPVSLSPSHEKIVRPLKYTFVWNVVERPNQLLYKYYNINKLLGARKLDVPFIICTLPRSGLVTKATISPHKKGPLTPSSSFSSSSSTPQPHSPQKRGRNIASKHTSSSSHFRLSLSRSEKRGGRDTKKPASLPPSSGLSSSKRQPRFKRQPRKRESQPKQQLACLPSSQPRVALSFAAASVLLSRYMSHGLGSLSLSSLSPGERPRTHPSFLPFLSFPWHDSKRIEEICTDTVFAKDFASKQPKSLQKYCRFSIQN